MKHTAIIIALALLGTGAFFTPAQAGKKKKKEVVTTPVKSIVTLRTPADSLSYAAGQALTQGMMEYVTGQLKVDTAYMADFVAGLTSYLNTPQTPQLTARAAGENIGRMLRDNMLPRMREQMEHEGLSVSDSLLLRGFTDAVEQDHSVFSVEEAAAYHQAQVTAAHERTVAAAKAAGAAWLADNAKRDSVETTASGLQYKVITRGTGPVATADDDVTVRYEGRLTDGTVFDSSYTRDPNTTTFKPTQVIKGWTEALTTLPEGTVCELYIPEALGYGERPSGKIPAYSTLVFRLEIVKVEHKAEAAPAPAAKPAAKKKATARRRK